MSDRYTYTDHRVQLDSADRSENNAQGLSGYHLDVRLQPDWPGLDPDPHKQRFDCDEMRAVADRIVGLVADLASTTGAGTPRSIQEKGAPSFGPESWAAAQYLKTASDQVVGTVAEYTRKLVENLEEAAKSIRRAAENHEKVEHANQQSGRHLEATLNSTPTAF